MRQRSGKGQVEEHLIKAIAKMLCKTISFRYSSVYRKPLVPSIDAYRCFVMCTYPFQNNNFYFKPDAVKYSEFSGDSTLWTSFCSSLNIIGEPHCFQEPQRHSDVLARISTMPSTSSNHWRAYRREHFRHQMIICIGALSSLFKFSLAAYNNVETNNNM